MAGKRCLEHIHRLTHHHAATARTEGLNVASRPEIRPNACVSSWRSVSSYYCCAAMLLCLNEKTDD